MVIKADRNSKRVLLVGERFEVALTWSQALNLGSLLIEQSAEVEPELKGKTFSTSMSRWG